MAEDLVHRESQRLYSIAFSILRDTAEAEDAVQETMVSAMRSPLWEQGGGPPPAWLTRVCVNRCLNSRRGRIRHLRLARRLAAAAGVGAAFDPHHLDLERAYVSLSRRQRAALALRYFHGYSVEECAELMGARPGTVRSHLARALERLRREMTP